MSKMMNSVKTDKDFLSQKYDMILIDADETVFDFKKAEHDAFKLTIESVGVEFTEEKLSLYSSINLMYWKKFERNEVTGVELKRRRYGDFFEAIGVSGIDLDRINDVYLENLSNCSSLIDGAMDFIKELSLYCTVIIITNGLTKAQRGRFDKSGLKPYVKALYISEEIGYSKPDKEYFDYVLESEGVKDRKRVLVIGDSLTSDMQGGKNAGIDTCRYIRDICSYPPDEKGLCKYTIDSYDQFFDILFDKK